MECIHEYHESQPYKYVFDQPAPNWSDKSFDDANWKSGPGGFGLVGTQNIGQAGTVWNTPDIWLRRTFTLPTLSAEQLNQLFLTDYHDEDIEVYFNGVLAYKKDGYSGDYENTSILDAGRAALVAGGANVIAVHCHQTAGGQYVDVGLTLKVPAKK